MRNATTHKVTSTAQPHFGVGSDHFVWTNDAVTELMLGMLTRALEEIRDRRKSVSMRKEAKDWLMLDDVQSPFSALNCCRTLGLDLSRLRDMTNTLMNGELYNDF